MIKQTIKRGVPSMTNKLETISTMNENISLETSFFFQKYKYKKYIFEIYPLIDDILLVFIILIESR